MGIDKDAEALGELVVQRLCGRIPRARQPIHAAAVAAFAAS